jgi:hypothetical protein
LREEYKLRVLENRAAMKTFGRKRNEVTGECRRLHNEELFSSYSTPIIISEIKSIRKRCIGQVAHIGNSKAAHRIVVGNLRARDHLEDLGADGKIIQKWILRSGVREWIGLIWNRTGTGSGCECVMKFRVP